MPHDANGQLLNDGDEVWVPCKIKSVKEGEYCTTKLITKFPMYPNKYQFNNFWLNSRQVVKDPSNITYITKE